MASGHLTPFYNMLKFIKMGGKDRPVLYGMSALRAYEEKTGRNALDDFLSLEGESVSVTLMSNLLYFGVWNGYRAEKLTLDFDEYDAADWCIEPGVFQQAMELFKDAFPAAKGDAGGASKKPQRLPEKAEA